MFVLYSGSGSHGFELVQPAFSRETWLKLRDVAARMLRTRGYQSAASAFEAFEMELSEAENSFGDEFVVLHWTAALEDYVAVSEATSNRTIYRHMADAVREVTGKYVRFVAVDLDTDEGPKEVAQPKLQRPSVFVERALEDAETLLQSTGAASAVDRVHSAFHGYLKALCDERAISFPADASITQLITIIRRDHPALARVANGDTVLSILRAFSAVVDRLNPTRNRHSMAHPTDSLLHEDEAMLVINAVRTMLHYLDAKLG